MELAALSCRNYLLMGPQGKEKQKRLKAWMVKMQAEVARKNGRHERSYVLKYNDIVEQII